MTSSPFAAVQAGELAAEFGRRFGGVPDGVWHAPGRVVLMGEPLDPSGGPLLTAALPWGVTAAVRMRTSGVRVAPRRFRPAARRAAAAAAAAGLVPAGSGFDAVIATGLPHRSGLGTGTAAEAALLLALAGGDTAAAADAARPDAAALLRAEAGTAMRINRLRGTARTQLPFDLEAAGLQLLLTGVRGTRGRVLDGARADLRSRRTAARRRTEVQRATRLLTGAGLLDSAPLHALRDLPAALGAVHDPVLRGRVQHVVTEANRLQAAAGLLRAGVPGDIGAVMSATHLSQRGAFAAVTPEVDQAVESAVGFGARGARTAGGRVGGAVVALAAADRTETIARGIGDAFTRRGLCAPWTAAALPSRGAHRLT
ncbi:galactokinase family protein [Nocardiopsis coralliicola]